MSKFLSILLSASLLTTSVSPAFSADETPAAKSDEETVSTAYYETLYVQNAEKVCATWKPVNEDASVLKIPSITYPKIGSSEALQTFKNGLGGTESNPSSQEAADFISKATILYSLPYNEDYANLTINLDAASSFYKVRMGQIYACAMINHKIRTHRSLLKTIEGERPRAGNLMKKLEAQTVALEKELSTRSCADRTKTEGRDNQSTRAVLLKQTTYEYCNYRHYLNYLEVNSKLDVAKFVTQEKARADKAGGSTGTGSKFNTRGVEAFIGSISEVSTKTSKDIAHSKEVYPQAFVAYTEFERTYASHIALLFVLEDYVLIRDSLKMLMNPLGQVLYKASNAQSPKSP